MRGRRRSRGCVVRWLGVGQSIVVPTPLPARAARARKAAFAVENASNEKPLGCKDNQANEAADQRAVDPDILQVASNL